MTDSSQAAPGKHADNNESEPSDFLAKVVSKLGHLFAVFFIVSMGILIFEVVMRYVFNQPTIWVHETTIFLCGVCFLFGGLHSVSRNGHIRIVVLYDYVGEKVRRWLDIAIYTVCACATAMFSYAIWPTVVKSFYAPNGEFRMITSGSAWNPPFPALLRAFLLIILVIMTIQFLVFVINRLRNK